VLKRCLAVLQIVLGDRQVIRAGRPLGEYAHLVDEVGYELAPPDLEYLHGLPRGFERCAVSDSVPRRTVAVYQYSASHLATTV
jgi:hypothetical protein